MSRQVIHAVHAPICDAKAYKLANRWNIIGLEEG